MRTIVALVALASLAFAGGAAAHVNKGHGPKAAAVGASTIVLNETAPGLGEYASFTTDIEPLVGQEYPMVAVWCYQDGANVYMDLGQPDASFLLGGGWSPWLEAGGDAQCHGTLYAYDTSGAGETVRQLASTPEWTAVDGSG